MYDTGWEAHAYHRTCSGVLEWGHQELNSDLSMGWTISLTPRADSKYTESGGENPKTVFHLKMDDFYSMTIGALEKIIKCGGCEGVSLPEHP